MRVRCLSDVPEDEEILQLFEENSEEAIEVLMRKYGSLCRYIVEITVKTPEDIEECMNDVFLNAWKELCKKRPYDLKSYLCGIAKHIALKHVRDNCKSKTHGITVCRICDFEEELLPCKRYEEEISLMELMELIDCFLSKEEKLTREIFAMRYLDALPAEYIAKHYGMKVETVKTRIYRVKRKLKLYLIRNGYINLM